MKFSDIPKLPNIHYSVSVDWKYLGDVLERYLIEHHLNMNPDFQRGHVWTEEQQIKYVEYMLTIPNSGKHIYFNHPGWMGSFRGEFVLVDGLQRITAATRFMKSEIKAYGHFYNEFEGNMSSEVQFIFNIAKLPTRKDVLKWYVDMNAGGTPHSAEEIERVKNLMVEKPEVLK
jgi:uncharacterized protein with ParB-like and HNH nuclease domain